MSTDTDAPLGLERAQHVELAGRDRGLWNRRAGLLAALALPVLTLIGLFGQRAVITNASSSPKAVLSVNSPAHLRGGLVFTTEITVQARSPLHDMQLRLDPGWFRGMVFNGIAPQPTNEDSQDGQVVYDYGSVDATTFKVWISWQANPTNVGMHRQNVALYDGSEQLAIAHRDVTVFP
jgi:hypothetical protein